LFLVLVVFVLFFPPFPVFPGFLRATLTMALFSASLLPLSDAIITTHAKTIGADFARIRMGGTIGYAFVVLVIGIYIKANPSSMFYCASVGYFLLAAMSFTLPKTEVLPKLPKAQAGEKGNRIFRTNMVFFVLAFLLTIQIGLLSNSSFIGAYVVDLGYSQFYVGMLMCISAMSEVPVLLVINRAIARFGTMKILIFTAFMGSVRLVISSFGTLPMLILGQCMQSITYMTGHYTSVIYIRENVLPGKASMGQSVLVMVQTGIASIVGNAVAGQVLQFLGFQGGFRFMATVLVVANGILCLIYYLCLRRRAAGGTGPEQTVS